MNLTNEEIEKRISDSYELPNRVIEKYPHPLVSIRTSTYNHEPYIKQCIEGVLMQKTNFPFEYIIGEDYSTDETRKIVFEYARKYPDIIRVITADYNVGSKANGRRCIRACRGKYIAICEGDDYWTDPLKLQKQVDFLENHPEYGMCYTKVRYYYQDSAFLGKEWGGNYTSFEDLFKKNTIPTLSCIYRKQLYEEYVSQVGPKIKDWKMGDYPLWLWFSHESKIAFLPIVTGVYRILKHSASHSTSLEAHLAFNMSYMQIKEFFNYLFRVGIPNHEIQTMYWLAQLRSYAVYACWSRFFTIWIKGVKDDYSRLFRPSSYKYFLFFLGSRIRKERM